MIRNDVPVPSRTALPQEADATASVSMPIRAICVAFILLNPFESAA